MFTAMHSDGHYMVKDNEIIVFRIVFDREREVVTLSLENLQRIISSFENSNSWSLQLLRITNSRRAGTQYASRQITLSPNGKLSDFINEISARYTGTKNNLSQLFTGVFEYDGSAISNRIYKLTKSNPLVEAECSALLEAIADPDCESDPLNFDPQAYLIKGQVKIGENDISVKLISMQKPITVLRHKFLRNDGVFKEISDKVLSLKPTLDVIIIEDTVYLLTLAGENLFHMERAYRKVCAQKVEAVCQTNIISDVNAFKEIATSGHNPRRFIAFNEGRLAALQNQRRRVAIARKFSIPLSGDAFDTTIAGVPEKIVKLLCDKGMIDPFENSAVEVEGAKKWS